MKSIASLILLLASGLAVVPASAFDAPQDIVLMLDNSGSMRQNDPQFLTAVAVRRFLEQVTGDTRVAVLAFDENVRWVVPLTALDDGSRATFLESLDEIDYTGQFTDSPKAMEQAIYELNVNGRAIAEKSIVFMTDGIVDTGDKARDLDKARWMQEDLAADAADGEIRIFGIAFTENADFQLIQAVSRRTRGGYYRAFSAADIDSVFERIIESLDEGIAIQLEPTEATFDLPEVPEIPAFEGDSDESAFGEDEPTFEGLEEESEPLFDALADGESSLDPLASETESLPGDDSWPDELPSLDASSFDADEESPLLVTPESAPASDTSGVGADGETTADETPANGVATVEADASNRPEDGANAPESGPFGLSSQWLLVSAAGAIAVVLALAAVVFMMLRRRKPAAPEAYIPKAFLNDLAGVTEKPSYELTDTLTIVGRMRNDSGAANYVVIEESTIGRNHAMIEFKDHAFCLVDQGSLNGTFVNGERIEGERRLKHGDRLRFHKHEFEFVMLEMFETDRTMMSETQFAEISSVLDTEESDMTQPRAGATTTVVPGAR